MDVKSLVGATKVAVVSVNQSFTAQDSIATAREYAKGSWSASLKRAEGVDYLIAVKSNVPVAIWKVLDVYVDHNSYTKKKLNGGHRIAFDLGEPMTISPELVHWFLSDENNLNLSMGIHIV